jgi:hypothetical protein
MRGEPAPRWVPARLAYLGKIAPRARFCSSGPFGARLIEQEDRDAVPHREPQGAGRTAEGGRLLGAAGWPIEEGAMATGAGQELADGRRDLRDGHGRDSSVGT